MVQIDNLDMSINVDVKQDFMKTKINNVQVIKFIIFFTLNFFKKIYSIFWFQKQLLINSK